MYNRRENLIELLKSSPTDVREKLVELLLDMPFGNSTEEAEERHASDTADYLIANGVTVQEWISVKDRLPVLHIDDYEEPDGSRVQFEVSEDQWVFTASGHKTKARYETGAVFQGWVGDYGETIRDVTHWMPLPEPPKGELQCE